MKTKSLQRTVSSILRILPYENRLRLYADEKVEILKACQDLPADELGEILLWLQTKYSV